MEENLNLSPLPSLETSRLTLRPLYSSDAKAIYEYSKDPVFYSCLKRKTPLSFEQVELFVSDLMQKKPLLYWMVTLKETKQLIGDCGFWQYHKDAGRIELCYGFAPAFWNHGYATEAVVRIIQFGFENVGANRIQAICNIDNDGSEKVLLKSGLTLEGILRHYILCEGLGLDMKMYSILKQEWLEKQKIA